VLAALVLLFGLALLVGWEISCLGQVVLAERVRFLSAASFSPALWSAGSVPVRATP
jgi:hypothetical protein